MPGPNTWPNIGPNDDSIAPYLDNGFLPSRGVQVSEPDCETADHAQIHENAYRLGIQNNLSIGKGWVRAPAGIDGLSPVTFSTPVLLTDGTHTVTPHPGGGSQLLSCGAYTTTASADVSGWLAPGMKFRCTDSAARKDCIVLGVSGAGVTLLTKNSTDLFAIDNGSVFYGPRPADFSYNRDDWSIFWTSPGTDNYPTLSAANTWTVYGGANAMVIPPGEWHISFSMLVQLSTVNPSSLQLQAGLENPTGTTQPPQSDLIDEVLVNNSASGLTDVRHRFTSRADRHLTAITVFAMVLSSGASVIVANSGSTNKSITVAQSRMPTTWRAVSTLL